MRTITIYDALLIAISLWRPLCFAEMEESSKWCNVKCNKVAAKFDVKCFEIGSNSSENAYCKTDGTIVICGGMLRLFENEDELAVVVAHEIGHLIAKHKGAHNPEKEMEADRIGLELMAKAGYDPNAAVEFWTRYYERIGWWEGDGTHQEPHERIETLKTLLQRKEYTK